MATTRLHLNIDVPKGRMDALERRDEIVEKLKELGIRLSMTDDGTYVYLVDQGIPTLGERICKAPLR